jgi:hypothetical protein
VEHFLYSSVGSTHRQTGIPHFESKWEVEEHVRQIGLPYTILRPVFFMKNWVWMRERIFGGTLSQPLDLVKPFQQVAVEDIGAFAAIAFERPDEWIGREVDLAGDEQTIPEIAASAGDRRFLGTSAGRIGVRGHLAKRSQPAQVFARGVNRPATRSTRRRAYFPSGSLSGTKSATESPTSLRDHTSGRSSSSACSQPSPSGKG